MLKNSTLSEKPVKITSFFYSLFFKTFLLVLIAIPPLSLLVIILKFSVNVPFMDEWNFIPLVVKLHTGGFTFNDFWADNFGHRLVFPRFLMLALAQLGGWDIVKENLANFTLACLTLLLIWRMLLVTVKPVLVLPVLLVSALFIFSLVQWENWLWGFELCWYLITLCAVATSWALTYWLGRWFGLISAAFIAIIMTYSLATGMLIWVVVGLALLLQYRVWGWQKILVWMLLGAGSIALYFNGYVASSTQYTGVDVSFVVGQPFTYLAYLLSYLGGVVFGWGSQSVSFSYESTTPIEQVGRSIAPWWGLLGLIVISLATFYNWRYSLKTKDNNWRNSLPWLQLSLFGLLAGVILGLTRSQQLGFETALASRYTTVSILFWIGFSGVLAIALGNFFQVARFPSKTIGWTMLSSAALVMFLALAISWVNSYGLLERHSLQLQDAALGLYNYDKASDEVLRKVYPSSDGTRYYMDLLKQNKLLFSTPKTDFQRQLDEKWQSQLSNTAYNRLNCQADWLTLSYGEVASLKAEGGTLSFVAKSLGLSFYLKNEAINQPRSESLFGFLQRDRQILDVQAKKAEVVNIYWDTGKGLREAEKYTANSIESTDGWRHFRIVMPPNLVALRIDLHYGRNSDQTDMLKVDVYTKK